MKFENIISRINNILIRRGYYIPETKGFEEFFSIPHKARILALANFEKLVKSRLDNETLYEVMLELDNIHVQFNIPCV